MGPRARRVPSVIVHHPDRRQGFGSVCPGGACGDLGISRFPPRGERFIVFPSTHTRLSERVDLRRQVFEDRLGRPRPAPGVPRRGPVDQHVTRARDRGPGVPDRSTLLAESRPARPSGRETERTFRHPVRPSGALSVPFVYSSVPSVVDLFRESASTSRHDQVVSLLASLPFKTPRGLALENLALRQQLAALHQSVKRPRLSQGDRCSMSRNILLLSGPRSKSSRPSPGSRRLGTCCGTEIESTPRPSSGASPDSPSNRCGRRHALRGRIRSSNVERLIGALRRECFDHVIVLNERHLKRIWRQCVDYYHACRTHVSLAKDAPEPRRVESPTMGKVTAVRTVGGLHHHYTRLAA